MAEKKVTTIPATISKSMESYSVKPKKRRVAGYARVSTDHMGEYDRLKSEINARKIRLEKIRMFIRDLKKQKEPISEFDPALWCSLLEHIIINKNEATVVFRDGSCVNIAVDQ